MHVVESGNTGPLFRWQYSLRMLLYVVTAVSVLLAFFQLVGWEYALALLAYAFVLLSFYVAGFAIWLATRSDARFIGLLTFIHLAIASVLLIGPIFSYHINGRAWYDYGLSEWNPPMSHYPDGRVGIDDYDPEVTPPAVWPVIGPVMLAMCDLSLFLVLFPPTALVVAVALPIMAVRLRRLLTMWQKACVFALWAIGALPAAYMIVWGGKVFDWIID